jgi:hypothetical protein
MHRALAEAVELFEAGLESCQRSEDRAVVDKYLSALAPILAAAVLGKDVLGRLQEVERLFSHTWLMDQAPFEPALSKWREFRREYEQFVVRGMTVNERLYAFSLLESYDQAVAKKDLKEVEGILKAVHVDDDSIANIVARIRAFV